MEFNSDFKKQLIKGEREAVDTVIDSFGDKAYSFALCYFGNRLTAEEAVKKSFSAFFANAAALLRDSSVPAAYFALLKGWCEHRMSEAKKEGKSFDYSAFSDRSEIIQAIAKVISELNRKEKSLFLLADVVCLKRNVLCEIYGVEYDAVADAVSICRDKVITKLSAIGDFSMKGGEQE
ncbi:MAG: hypothetical protein IKA51_03690 [Clostridia bacterium]|nr:hypothetical protein [Clostridia bacterium]